MRWDFVESLRVGGMRVLDIVLRLAEYRRSLMLYTAAFVIILFLRLPGR